MPAENLIYLADTQYVPYGSRSADFIESRVLAIAEFLIRQPVKLLIVACNTATAAAVNALREKYQIPIIGLEPALKPAVAFSNNDRVGVLATQTTLESKKYQTLKSRFCEQAEIIEKASPLFVELVEYAPKIGTEQHHLVEKELQPFIEAKVDSLVLGCTHFPFLTQTIAEIMGSQVRLFESGMPVAKEARRRLENNLNPQKQNGRIHYFSSAPEKAQQSFDLLLGKRVDIEVFGEH